MQRLVTKDETNFKQYITYFSGFQMYLEKCKKFQKLPVMN